MERSLSQPSEGFSLALPRSQSKSIRQKFEDGGHLPLKAVSLNISQKRVEVILSFGGLKITER
jgi:hypothetical protein